jgi:hypothetical protein
MLLGTGDGVMALHMTQSGHTGIRAVSSQK